MICVTLAGLLLAVASGQHYVPDSTDFLDDSALRTADLQRYWQAEVPLPHGDGPVSATLVDEILYVISQQGNAVALHAGTGLVLWTYPVCEEGSKVLPPTHLLSEKGVGPVVFVAGRKVHVLDRTTGQLLAEFDTGFPAGSSAVGDEETIYLGSADGHMYALNWTTARIEQGLGRAVQVWRVGAKGPIRSKPSFDGLKLFFASEGGDLYSCVAYSRVEIWSRQLLGSVFGDLVVQDGSVYVNSADRSVYRLDEKKGAEQWRSRLPMPLRDDMYLTGRIILQPVPGDSGGLFAVDADTGRELWQRPGTESFVARDGDLIYLLASDGEHLLAVDAGTGVERQSVDIPEAKIVVPNAGSEAIYVVSAIGQAACIRPAHVPYLTLKELAAVREQLQRGQQGETDSTEPQP